MLEFGLTREHLQNLPRKELFPKKAMYNTKDVYHKALQVFVFVHQIFLMEFSDF